MGLFADKKKKPPTPPKPVKKATSTANSKGSKDKSTRNRRAAPSRTSGAKEKNSKVSVSKMSGQKKSTERPVAKKDVAAPPKKDAAAAAPKETEGPGTLEDEGDQLIQLPPPKPAANKPNVQHKPKTNRKVATDNRPKNQQPPSRRPPESAGPAPKGGEKKKKKPAIEAHAFLQYIEKKGWAAIEEEFHVGHKAGCTEINRDTRYVISFNVPPDGDFYDANKVEIPGIENKFIAASLPVADTTGRENFWRLVYDSEVRNVFILEDFQETQKSPFLPMEAQTSKDYGKITIMNKKATQTFRDFQAVLESLPEGCSNSVVLRLINAMKWPTKIADEWKRMALHMVRLIKDDKGLCIVVCKDGQKKTGVFILLFAVITKILAAQTFTVPEMLSSLRGCRWGAIQTPEEYLLVYDLAVEFVLVKAEKDHGPMCKRLLAALSDHMTKKAKQAGAAAANQRPRGAVPIYGAANPVPVPPTPSPLPTTTPMIAPCAPSPLPSSPFTSSPPEAQQQPKPTVPPPPPLPAPTVPTSPAAEPAESTKTNADENDNEADNDKSGVAPP